jgi:hypothetical protein
MSAFLPEFFLAAKPAHTAIHLGQKSNLESPIFANLKSAIRGVR